MSCANSECKNCNETCNVAQTFCPSDQKASDHGGEFSWPDAINDDHPIISQVWTASAWNSLKSAISSAYNKGSNSSESNQGCDSAGQSFGSNPMLSASSGGVVTADIYNSAAAAINKLKSGAVSNVTGISDDGVGTVIRKYHAVALANGYNNGKILSTACNTCNIECNAECDMCIGCDTCEGVQHYSTCYSNTPPPSSGGS